MIPRPLYLNALRSLRNVPLVKILAGVRRCGKSTILAMLREELIASVKQAAPQTVILCNTGCRPDTIARKLAVADGAVVGTYFKEGGRLENEQLENVRVCADRVRELMQVVYQVRAR